MVRPDPETGRLALQQVAADQMPQVGEPVVARRPWPGPAAFARHARSGAGDLQQGVGFRQARIDRRRPFEGAAGLGVTALADQRLAQIERPLSALREAFDHPARQRLHLGPVLQRVGAVDRADQGLQHRPVDGVGRKARQVFAIMPERRFELPALAQLVGEVVGACSLSGLGTHGAISFLVAGHTHPLDRSTLPVMPQQAGRRRALNPPFNRPRAR